MRLCLSHSSRSMDLERCSLNHLTRRYGSPSRLINPPPLESLSGEYDSQYIGSISLWELGKNPERQPELVTVLKKNYKAQHALIRGDKLFICGTAFIEVCRLDGSPISRLSDPWFAGGHTIFPTPTGKLAVSCSASDAVLVFDVDTEEVIALRIPEGFYGHNYDLDASVDLRTHYIRNDLQRTHINCAVPFENGFLVSMLIPGAVGWIGYNGDYRELVSGFVGCHGVRTRPGLDGFYFTDSTSGTLVEMSLDGRVQRRFSVASRWLHDCEWVADELYLFSLSDTNRLELWDVHENQNVWSVDLGPYGSSAQFSFVC